MLFHSNKRDVLRVMSKVNGPSPNTEMGRNTKKFQNRSSLKFPKYRQDYPEKKIRVELVVGFFHRGESYLKYMTRVYRNFMTMKGCISTSSNNRSQRFFHRIRQLYLSGVLNGYVLGVFIHKRVHCQVPPLKSSLW